MFNRKLFVLLVASLGLLGAGCVAPARPPATAPPPAVGGDLSRAIYDRLLEELLPELGDPDPAVRQRAQQDFEQLCFLVGHPGDEPERTLLCASICAHIGPGTPGPARLWMLRQLERIGGDESVDTLEALLEDDDPLVREGARRALQHNPAPRAGRVLRAAFEKTEDVDWQIALINALGARRETGAVAPIVSLIYRERYEPATLAAAAIAALGEIGGPEALEWLSYFWMGGAPANLRPTIADALLRCAERDIQDGRTAAASRTLNTLLGYTGPARVRIGALRCLTQMEQVAGLPRLLAYINDDKADPQMRAVAAELAAELPGFAVTVSLAGQLPQVSNSARVLLLDALAARGDPAALPAVITQLANEDQAVRLAALHATGVLGDAGVAVLLARSAAESQGELRDAARRSLWRLRGPGVDEALLATLTNARPPLSLELISALKERHCRAAIAALLRAARDDADEVRVAAFEALGALAEDRDVPALVNLLTELVGQAPGEVEEAAEDAVVAACQRSEPAEQRAGAVLDAWDSAPPTVQAALLRVLGRVGGPGSLDKIRGALSSDNDAVLDAAVRALAQWPDTEARDELLALAQKSTNPTHRVLALQGFVRLVRQSQPADPLDSLELYRRALALAERPEERQAVLGGLATVRHPAAIPVVETMLTDPQSRAEAEAALVSIAERIGVLHRDLAYATLERVEQETSSPTVQQRAAEVRQKLRKSEGCLVHWEYSGPYSEPDRDWEWLHKQPLPPETPNATVTWRPLEVTNADEPWVFDLRQLDRASQLCVYVRTRVWSPQAQAARLDVGSDDSIKVWLNGQVVHERSEIRGHTPLQDHVPVTLTEGWNTLLIKITQCTGAWGFSAAIRSPQGDPLEGLRFGNGSTPTP